MLLPPALEVLSLRAREAAEAADRVEGLAPARKRTGECKCVNMLCEWDAWNV